MKCCYQIWLALLLCAISSPGLADTAHSDDDVFTLTVENDSLGSGADRNYTSGVRFGWLQHYQKPSLVARTLDKLVPFNLLNDTTTVSYSLGQNFYTPKVISAHIPDPADRPYAGFLYGTVAVNAANGNHVDNLELTAGIIGPAALGLETQRFVHAFIDGVRPEGWKYQLKNEPGLMVSWERLWPDMLNSEIGDVYFRAGPYTGATLGNIYTYANSGLIFQLMSKKYKSQSTPQRMRPALAGNGYAAIPDGEFSWCVFAGLEGRLVGRNIFLDGNTFTDSPSVGKKPFVGDANLGVAFDLGRALLSYTLNWRSQEFYGQDNTDLFGSVGLSYRF
ncbi:MAG: lipid A deacylase LpxR family protein [Alphaproteobacteria bacterium]|nr:lipid A deacylase LpxR family protein [Alphaproteobacteria bacterium]